MRNVKWAAVSGEAFNSDRAQSGERLRDHYHRLFNFPMNRIEERNFAFISGKERTFVWS